MLFKRLVLVGLLLPLIAEAAPAEDKGRARKLLSSGWQIRMDYALMQESIKLKSGSNEANMEAQSQGLLGGASYAIPFEHSRWRSLYGIDFGVAFVRGKGDTQVIADSLRGQRSIILGAHAGLLFYSSPYSALGVSVPFHFRLIQWSLQPGSPLDPDRDSSYSVGLAGHYLARFTRNSSMHVSVTYHALWEATLWNVGWQFDLL